MHAVRSTTACRAIRLWACGLSSTRLPQPAISCRPPSPDVGSSREIRGCFPRTLKAAMGRGCV